MKTLLLASSAALVLIGQGANAERRVYSGAELTALKCAAYYSYVTQVMENRGLLSDQDMQSGANAGQYILTNYIGGTWDQKFQAYEQILTRMPRDDLELIDAAADHLESCEMQYFQ